MVEDKEENAERCRCPNCPTYSKCMKDDDEVLYCARAKSGCEVEPKGCSCPGGCPVYKDYGLTSAYYCTNGKA